MANKDKKPLFSSGWPFHFNAVRMKEYEGSWYCDGFIEAGQILIQQSIEPGNTIDSLVFPIIYLFRHGLELKLKRVIDLSCDYLEQEKDRGPEHKLNVLWGKAEPLIREAYKHEEVPLEEAFDLEQVAYVFSEFEKYDRTSTTFRYPHGLNGEMSLPEEIQQINLLTFWEHIEPVDYMLSCLEGGLIELVDYKQNASREYE